MKRLKSQESDVPVLAEEGLGKSTPPMPKKRLKRK